MAGRVRERAPVGPAQARELRDPAVQLVADQRAVLHQVPRLRLDALVVVPDGREPVLGGPVARHVHDGGAVRQLAQLVEGGERGSRVRRLVPQSAVELGGVADRLVDGEPEIGRVDDQVVRPGLDARRTHLLGQQPGNPLQLGVPVPAGARQVLPAAPDRRSDGPHRVELAGGPVHGDRRELRMHAHPLLRGDGARGVRVELVLVDRHQRGVHVRDTLGPQEPAAPLGEQRRLLLVRYGERVDVVRRDPGPLPVRGLVGQLHPLVRAGRGDHLRRQLCHGHGLRGHLRRCVHRQIDPGREPPRPAVHDPYRVSEVGGVRRPGGPGVTEPPGRAPYPLEPEVRVYRAERACPCERRVGEGTQRQRQE